SAAVIGMAVGLIIQPGTRALVDEAAARAPASTGSWMDFLRGLVPANMLGLEARTQLRDDAATTALNFNVLQIVIISIVIGIAALRVGPAAEAFLEFNRSEEHTSELQSRENLVC